MRSRRMMAMVVVFVGSKNWFVGRKVENLLRRFLQLAYEKSLDARAIGKGRFHLLSLSQWRQKQ